jgi:glycosyltransferase involved in cell wall biosynthesis
MNVVFLIDTIASDTAGTQKQLLETIRRLAGGAVRPQLVCLYESPWMTRNPLPCPCTVLGYRGLMKANLPAVLARLAGLVRRERIDIIQTFFEDSIFVAWLATRLRRRAPVLISSRRDIGLGAGNQPWYHGLFARALPRVNRGFAGIIANSTRVRDYAAARERTPLEKFRVLRNGIELPDLSPSGEPPDTMARIPADCWIVMVASLTPVKRHDVAIRAFAGLRERTRGDAHLLLLGDGPLRGELEALARTCGVADSVHFAGAVREVDAYLRHADIGVLCSDREGLSNAILEYMAYGLPVVATAVGGNPELVNEHNGALVAPADVAALTHALAVLVDDAPARESRGARARLDVERDFSWPRAIGALEDYYRQLSGEATRGRRPPG